MPLKDNSISTSLASNQNLSSKKRIIKFQTQLLALLKDLSIGLKLNKDKSLYQTGTIVSQNFLKVQEDNQIHHYQLIKITLHLYLILNKKLLDM
jgi:hypothetical protein